MKWIKALEVNLIGIVQFSTRKVGEENLHYYESDLESRISVIFAPGGLNPELWNQQLRYFSRNFHTISFRPTVSYRNFKGEKSGLKAILDQNHVTDAVLVSNMTGNSLIQSFADREDVISTVLTNPRHGFNRFPQRRIMKALYSLSKFKPKIAGKLLFSKKTNYSTVKQFMNTLRLPDYEDFKTFIERCEVSKISENSLVIASAEDRLSDMDYAKRISSEGSLSVLNQAGTFSYYEKPQDFNKALLDFIKTIKDSTDNKNQINMSLKDFQTQKNQNGETKGYKPKQKVRV